MANKLILKVQDEIKKYHSALEEEVALAYLGLDRIPKNVKNPFLDGYIAEIEDPVDQIIALTTNADYLHFACRYILNLDVPPFQLAILDMLWRRKMPLLVATRGG